MKKIIGIIVLSTLVLITGCSTNNSKVKVIPGGGTANNSILISLNEIGPGMAEGFTDKDKGVIISQKETTYFGSVDKTSGKPKMKPFDKYKIYKVDLQSKEKKEVFSISPDGNLLTEISPDGRKLLCNDTLVDIESTSQKVLPEIPLEIFRGLDKPKNLPSYSFVEESNVVLVNPYYYIRKYSSLLQSSANTKSLLEQLNINSMDDLKKAGADCIQSPRLLPEQLKYIFIANKKDSEPCLYMLDLHSRKLTLLDTNVKRFDLSSDQQSIAYIKGKIDSNDSDKLFRIGVEGTEKKELAQQSVIQGIAWSPNSQWIAFTGGETGKSDVFAISIDKKTVEQLTYGMCTDENIAWAKGTNKIAFTSNPFNPKVYVAAVNIPDQKNNTGIIITDPDKTKATGQLLSLLKKETDTYIKVQ